MIVENDWVHVTLNLREMGSGLIEHMYRWKLFDSALRLSLASTRTPHQFFLKISILISLRCCK